MLEIPPRSGATEDEGELDLVQHEDDAGGDGKPTELGKRSGNSWPALGPHCDKEAQGRQRFDEQAAAGRGERKLCYKIHADCFCF